MATTKIHPGEPNEPEEGKHLFHSNIWVTGSLMHFIINRGIQKNLILVEVVKWLALLKMFHLYPYTSGASIKEAILTSTKSVACHMESSHSKMRYCVMLFPLKFVMFFWANLIYGNIMLYMVLGLTVLLLL
jgi:hypothetical protein